MSNARNLSNLLGTGTTIATASIADDAITSAKIADDAVVTAAIADDAITSALIADNAVGDAQFSGTTGKVLQVVAVNDATQEYTTSSSDHDTNLSATITPASTSNKVVVVINAHIGGNLNGGCYLKRGSTKIKQVGGSSASVNRDSNFFNADDYVHNDYVTSTMSVTFQDSPSANTATTYTLGYRRGTSNGGSFSYNRPVNNSTPKARSTMVLMEIEG